MSISAILACCLVSGNVHSVTGTPVVSASIDLKGSSHVRTRTDSRGDFVQRVPPGIYRLSAASRGYAALAVSVDARNDVRLDFALEPADSPKLREIGTVTVDGQLAPVQEAIPTVSEKRSDLEALGYDRIVEGLQSLPGATFTRPDGGASSSIAVVSLRGPDPSESLLALDGQLLNDGNTGDLDLSRLPASVFSTIDVTEGLGPEDSNGSNTFGGAIDLVSIRPTKDFHTKLTLSGGSFSQSEGSLSSSGTSGKLGYAMAVDDQNEGGYVNHTVSLYSSSDPTCSPCATGLGSSVASHTILGAATWLFSQAADVSARVFILGDNRDQSSAVNGVDDNVADVGTPMYGHYTGVGEETFAQVVRAYQLRTRAPLGAGELTAEASESDNNIAVAGGSASPYDIVHRDKRFNGAISWQRTFEDSQFAVGGYSRYESLGFEAPASSTGASLTSSQAQPLVGQTINVLYARGGFTPVPKLRLDGGLFESRYTTFGSNLDGRFGAIYELIPKTSLHFSLGTGFRAPLLAERYQFAYDQLTLDGNNVFVGQGSPNEKPEHATEYEIGASHEFSNVARMDISLYQTNLRNPVEIFYPLANVAAGLCAANSYAAPIASCVSYGSNVGNAVYQGAEFHYSQRFPAQHFFVSGSYGLNVAYPKNLNAQFSNPTSGGNLVDNAQFLGIPQQQGSVVADYTTDGWHAAMATNFRGDNNELNAAPFSVTNALVGKHLGPQIDVSLAATNLFSSVSGMYTHFGAGVPYRSVIGQTASGSAVYGPLPTDALFVEPIGVRFLLTLVR